MKSVGRAGDNQIDAIFRESSHHVQAVTVKDFRPGVGAVLKMDICDNLSCHRCSVGYLAAAGGAIAGVIPHRGEFPPADATLDGMT